MVGGVRHVGGDVRLVYPTLRTAGDGSGSERSEGSDHLLTRGLDKPVLHPRPF